MNELNTTETKPPAVQRISRKVRTAIDSLVSGQTKTITDAASAAGLTRRSSGDVSEAAGPSVKHLELRLDAPGLLLRGRNLSH
jgi:hypothetical protein